MLTNFSMVGKDIEKPNKALPVALFGIQGLLMTYASAIRYDLIL